MWSAEARSPAAESMGIASNSAGRSAKKSSFSQRDSYTKWKGRPARSVADDPPPLSKKAASARFGGDILATARKNHAIWREAKSHAIRLRLARFNDVTNFRSDGISFLFFLDNARLAWVPQKCNSGSVVARPWRFHLAQKHVIKSQDRDIGI
jgi:hypothetical protein